LIRLARTLNSFKDIISLRSLLLPAIAFAVCALAAPASADELPFVGHWDCGVGTFVFTSETYNNGSDDLPIQEVQEGTDGSYTLFFADDYTITLSGFTGDEMGWLSSSGESLECTRAE
jgi:hypothetical protein